MKAVGVGAREEYQACVGKSVFVLTGPVFQAIWGAGETKSTINRL